ncbi:MAG: transketolase [Deltaproteobacteria bacterium]
MNAFCRTVRQDILKVAKASGHGHIPSCFSVVEILCAIYGTIRHNPKDPAWTQRDIFILSKGHASLAHYCTLARLGYFDAAAVVSFGGFKSDFGCHADRLKVPGIEVSTGSLGHGIGVGVGMALAFKIQDSGRRVYAVIGDGEANEGSVWEALMVAANLGLDNLTVVYDNNMSHGRGLQIMNPAEKLAAFGCRVDEVSGHNVAALKEALAGEAGKAEGRPHGIVAHTKKGYGCHTMICDHYAWHRRCPTDEEFTRLMEELDEEAL